MIVSETVSRPREKAPRPTPRPDRSFYASGKAFGRFGIRAFPPQIMRAPHSHGHIEFNWLTNGCMGYVFDGGPITVGVGHENPSDDDARWTTINAAWDFKVVKVIGLYGFGKNGNQSVTNVSSSANTLPSGIPAAAGAGSDRRSYLIGVTAPIGNGELKASYGVLQAESTADVKYKLDKQFGLGYHYALSKRTTVYADYVNERRDFMPATFKKNGFDLGIKHNF